MNKLSTLLKHNKHISIKIDSLEKKLNVFDKSKIVKSIHFPFTNINEHIDDVYDMIISIDNINLYIPKIYIKE